MPTTRLLTLTLGLTLVAGTALAQDARPLDYPRELKLAGHRVLVHEPTVHGEADAERTTFRFPLEAVDPTGRRAAGHATATATTHLDLRDRTFLAQGFEFSAVTLSGVVAAEDEAAKTAFTDVFPTELVLRLELLYARPDLEPVGDWEDAKLAGDLPALHVRRTPAILVQIDGEPALVQVGEFPLHAVANTQSDLFRDDSGKRWLLLLDGVWAESEELSGPWRWVSGKLPVVMSQMERKDPRAHVRRWIPGTQECTKAFGDAGPPRPTEAAPEVLVAQEPAELVLLRGDPLLTFVRGSKLMQVANTESDLFFHPRQGKYFLLLSGRWYASENLESGWGPAYGPLPAEFAEIPVDSPRGHVRWCVAGTPEANEALARAALSEQFTLTDRSVPEVKHVDGEVQTVPTPVEGLSRVSSTEDDMLEFDGTYYLCVRGAWFESKSADRGWKPARELPVAIGKLDAVSPLFHVRFATPAGGAEAKNTFAYQGYYEGVFPRRGSVVHGTGRRPTGLLRNGNWYPHPRTFGEGRWYDPISGSFQPRSVVYDEDGAPRATRWSAYTASYGRVGAYADRYRQGGRRMFPFDRGSFTFDLAAGRSDVLGPWGPSIATREGLDRAKFPLGNRPSPVAPPEDTEPLPARMVVAEDGTVWRAGTAGAESFSDGSWTAGSAPAPVAAWLATFERLDARSEQLRAWAAARRADLPVNPVVTTE